MEGVIDSDGRCVGADHFNADDSDIATCFSVIGGVAKGVVSVIALIGSVDERAIFVEFECSVLRLTDELTFQRIQINIIVVLQNPFLLATGIAGMFHVNISVHSTVRMRGRIPGEAKGI